MDGYVLRILTQDVGCIAGINDAPICEDMRGLGLSSTRSVAEWVMPGENFFTVYLFWPPDRAFESGKAATTATLFIGQTSESETTRHPVAAMMYPIPGIPEAYPYRVRQKFQANPVPPTRLWGDAQPVERLSEGDQRDMVDLAERFRQTFVARNVQAMYDLTSYKFEDRARAEGFSPTEQRQAAMELYAEMVASNENVVAPLYPELIVFDSIANGAVYRLTQGSGQKLIRMEDAKTRRRIDIYMAKISGKWTIVR